MAEQKLSVYAKLAKARVKLQQSGLKKSGKNNYFAYFQLSDFLPRVNEIFDELGLCSVVSFTTDVATLTLFDSENENATIQFSSPMARANLKNNHEIQNLGAVETYQRRYLYMTAMEIVENDTLDAAQGDPSRQPVQQTPQKPTAPKPKTTQQTQATQSAPQPLKPKPFDEMVRERLSRYTTRNALQGAYDKAAEWVQQHYPNNLDEFNGIFDDLIIDLP